VPRGAHTVLEILSMRMTYPIHARAGRRRRVLFLALVLLANAAIVGMPMRAEAAGKVPAQFIAKMYSEALGRMPDPGGWAHFTKAFSQQGCSSTTLGNVARAFYTSTEYTGLPYPPAARVLTLYRGVFNREPDQRGLDQYTAQLQRGALTWRQLVEAFVSSQEFARLTPTICGSSTGYHFGTQPAPNLPPAGSGYRGRSVDELQNLLDRAPAGGVVHLARMTVVRVDKMLIVPAGKTLTTTGSPDPSSYALQGRLVRAGAFALPVVRLMPGASLRNVWVDGQRGSYVNYTTQAINVQALGGTGTAVTGSRISNSRGWTNVQMLGTYENHPCGGARVSGNLITAYSSDKTRPSQTGQPGWTDGLSVGCENTVVENNSIIDATDVSIALFRSGPARQQSIIRNNRLLNAGNSAWGAIGIDTGYDKDVVQDFTGSSVTRNTFWTGPDTHVAIGLAASTRPWFGTRNDASKGISFTDNSTGGFTANVGTGITVADTANATIQGNDLKLSVRRVSNCPHVTFGIDSSGHPTNGNFQDGAQTVSLTNASGGGCLG
jgi:Domain of unknown function (DUF4214)